jgi:hypothetical protein
MSASDFSQAVDEASNAFVLPTGSNALVDVEEDGRIGLTDKKFETACS